VRNPGAAFHGQITLIQIESDTSSVDFDDRDNPRISPFLNRFRVNAVTSSDLFLRDELRAHFSTFSLQDSSSVESVIEE
jgi:hypothetical protein